MRVDELLEEYRRARLAQAVTATDFEISYAHRVKARTLAVAIVEELHPTPGRPELREEPNR